MAEKEVMKKIAKTSPVSIERKIYIVKH